MKKLLFMLSMTAMVATVNGQTYPSKCNSSPKSDRVGFKITPSDMGNELRSATYSTLLMPVSFVQLVNKDSKWSLGNSFNIGLSYVLGSANALVHLDGSVTLSETFYYGVGTTYGVAQSPGGTVSSYTAGLVGGFNQFSLMLGRDFLQSNYVVGISYNLSGLPFFNDVTSITTK